MADSRRTVLITGCSADGIGETFALEFHSRDFRVFATARNLASMQTLKAKGIETFELDVTHSDSIAAARAYVEKLTGGKLDVLVNNAGVAYPYAAADSDMHKVKALFDVNLFAVMEMTQAFLPLLLHGTDARIIQIGSLSGIMPIPFSAAYNASKAAIHSFGDTLRVELAPFNIKVVTAVIGNVQTKLSKPWHVLPDDSIYQPIKAEYQSRRVDNFHKSAVPRETVVWDIVNEALKSSPRAWIWGGANAWSTWFVSTFVGRTVSDWLLSRMFALDKLAEIKTREKKYL